jgi:hypothetical protein
LSVLASQSSPSYSPSPLMAMALCTCHLRPRSSGRPSPSHTSDGDRQPFMSCMATAAAKRVSPCHCTHAHDDVGLLLMLRKSWSWSSLRCEHLDELTNPASACFASPSLT